MMSAMLAIALCLSEAGAQPVPEQVTMTLDQFLRMYEETKTRPPEPEGAPFQWSLSAAQYMGEVVFDDDEPVSAVFQTSFRVENLREDGYWVRVPLLPATVAVREARLGGKDAPIVLENGWYTLVTDEPGVFEVGVSFAVAVSTVDGSSGFVFDLAGSGATEVELAVPVSEDLDFTIANAKLSSDRTVNGKRVVTGTLPATGALSVRWQREIPQSEKQAARVYAEVHTLVGVGDGLLTTRSTIQETILFDGIDVVRVKIPTDMTVLDVTGAGLRDWQVAADGTLTAQLNFAAEGNYSLVVDLERVLPDSTANVEVPLVEPLGVERSKGFVGIQATGSLEITPGMTEGTAPVDVRTLPATIVGVTDQPVLLGFKYLGATAKIPLVVSEHEEVDVLVTLLDQAEAVTMFTQDGRRLTSVKYQVRNNRRQFLRLDLPEKAELWSASVAGRSVQPAKSGLGSLLVPLVRSQAAGGALAAVVVEVGYVETGEPPDHGRGTFMAELPRADAPTTWVGWTVYAPARAKISKRSFDGSLRDVEFLTRPASSAAVYAVPGQNAEMQQMATSLGNAGGMGEGAAPVQVTLPVDGQPLFFEKLLALDEKLWVTFEYRGLK
jgi:hypothetical protein